MRYVHWAVACGGFLLLGMVGARMGSGPAERALADTSSQKEATPKTPLEELQAEIKKLQELVTDQAAIMTHVGYHWTNLWFALDKQNWPLADFYLSETRNNLKWAVRNRPFRKTAAGVIDLGAIAQALDNTQFAQLKDAIGKKDWARSVKHYDEAMQGCFACHKASEKPYLVPRRPQVPEVNVIDFAADAKAP
jgi:hypothetical protein